MCVKRNSIRNVLIALFLLSGNFLAEGKSGALLWKISGKDLGKPSYVLGTHQMVPSAYLDSIPGFRNAFAVCEQVVAELDMTRTSSLETSLLQAGMMPADSNYIQLLSNEDRLFLETKLNEIFGSDIQAMGMLKPSVINALYNVTLMHKYYPSCIGQESINMGVQKQGKPIIELTGIDNQAYDLQEGLSLSQQMNLLLCALKNEISIADEIGKTRECYYQADLDNLHQLTNANAFANNCSGTADTKATLHKNRIANWVTKLSMLMKEKASLVAVRCTHLAGPEGLLAQLEKKGYTVEPISY